MGYLKKYEIMKFDEIYAPAASG